MGKNKKKNVEMEMTSMSEKKNKSNIDSLSAKDIKVLDLFIDSLVTLNEKVRKDEKIQFSFFDIRKRKLNEQWESFKKDWKMNVTLDKYKLDEWKKLNQLQELDVILKIIIDYPYVFSKYVPLCPNVKQIIDAQLKESYKTSIEKDMSRLLSGSVLRPILYALLDEGYDYQQHYSCWIAAYIQNGIKEKENIIKKFKNDYKSELGKIILRRHKNLNNLLLNKLVPGTLNDIFPRDVLDRCLPADSPDREKTAVVCYLLPSISYQCTWDRFKYSKYNSFRYAYDGQDFDNVFDVVANYLKINLNVGQIKTNQKPK